MSELEKSDVYRIVFAFKKQSTCILSVCFMIGLYQIII